MPTDKHFKPVVTLTAPLNVRELLGRDSDEEQMMDVGKIEFGNGPVKTKLNADLVDGMDILAGGIQFRGNMGEPTVSGESHSEAEQTAIALLRAIRGTANMHAAGEQLQGLATALDAVTHFIAATR